LKCVTTKRWKQKEKYTVNLTSVERKGKDTTDNIKISHLTKKGSTKSEGDVAYGYAHSVSRKKGDPH